MSRKRVDLLSIHESTRSNIVLIFLIIIIFLHVILSIGESDAEILLKFKESLRNTGALSNWDKAGSSPCNRSANIWNGVLCNSKGKVWGLKLEKMELEGVIDVDTLKRLPDLRTISVMYNQFEGQLPNLTKLGALKTIYLSNNGFSGEIPATCFNRMMWLKKLHLANNKFEGSIPTTLAELPKLIELMLEKNEFTGQLPDFHQTNWQHFNASHNKLEGPIPASLSHFNASSFAANVELCGAPLQECPSQKRALSDVVIIVIVSLLVAGAFMALIAIVIILHRRKDSSSSAHEPAAPPDRAAPPPTGAGDLEQGRRQVAAAGSVSSPDHHNSGRQSLKLTFLKDSGDRFDISDLLKASAEVLGSGVLSSTYKASLFDGDKLMVVKRFKQMNNVGKEEFNEHMWRLGRLHHQNVLPLLAYYYRKEEKLLVMDYVDNVSLAFQLHGNRSRSTTLDWPRRLNIIKGVANGLLYLNHELPSVTTPHGHLKSANVLLDRSFKPLLTDYGFVPVVNQDHAQKYMVCYKSPEFKHTGQVTRKTDVWSLGILILEILTGRFPSNLLQQGGAVDVDLAMWVDSVVSDGGMEVFDGDMAVAGGTTSNNPSHGEMMKLLKIGLSCCQADLEQRPEIREAVEKIEEIKEKDVNVDDEFYSSYASDADMRSSRGLSDDFKND